MKTPGKDGDPSCLWERPNEWYGARYQQRGSGGDATTTIREVAPSESTCRELGSLTSSVSTKDVAPFDPRERRGPFAEGVDALARVVAHLR